jgi:hypothetical protein
MCDTCGCKGAETFDAEMSINTDKYKGHTPGPWIPASQDHHGRIMIKKRDDYWEDIGQMRTTPDKLLAADAPKILNAYKKLLAKTRVLDKIIAWHERNQLQGESIQYELDRINWMLENPNKDYDEYPYIYDGGFREGFEGEGFEAENLSFKEKVEKMIDVASPKFKGIKGLGKKIGAERGKKLDYKIQGVLPRAKGVSSYRRNIETPKWYKGIQLGIMTGLAGFITYKLATETPKEE